MSATMRDRRHIVAVTARLSVIKPFVVLCMVSSVNR